MSTPVKELVARAREELSSLTGLKPSSTLSTFKDERGWRVQVEMVEKNSIPESMDILASYEVLLDSDGKAIEFKRLGMRKRIDTFKGENEA